MGFSRVRGETRPDVYREVEEALDAYRQRHASEEDDDARHMADFGELQLQALEALKGLRLAGAAVPLAEWRRFYAELAAISVAALESVARRPGGR